MKEVKRFFEDHKALENKVVVVENLIGLDEAIKIIEDAIDFYCTNIWKEVKKS